MELATLYSVVEVTKVDGTVESVDPFKRIYWTLNEAKAEVLEHLKETEEAGSAPKELAWSDFEGGSNTEWDDGAGTEREFLVTLVEIHEKEVEGK